MENKYTSPKLSKLLNDNGCKLESDYSWWVSPNTEQFVNRKDAPPNFNKTERYFPAYDILNDICVKYAREFFGDIRRGEYTREVLALLQRNQKQEAEDYIFEHCLFNPKNK